MVQTAVDGQEALDAIELDCPDFLITDWEWPQISGLELCRQVRKMQLPHYVSIIFLTAKASVAEMIVGLEYGADDFLKKPVSEGRVDRPHEVELARARLGTLLEPDGPHRFAHRTC